MTIRRTVRLGRLGRTPEARVRWALGFRQLDLARLSERDRQQVWAALFAWQGGRPGPTRPADDGVPQAQQALREAVEAFANGLPDMVWVPETGWALFPPRRPNDRDQTPGRAKRVGRQSDLITRQLTQQTGQRVQPAAVVFALVDDLNAIGADRLRACALNTDGQRCGVIFLATRRQVFCSRPHALAAAWKRHAVKRKTNRRDY